MLENQFIQFSDSMQPNGCTPIPLVVGSNKFLINNENVGPAINDVRNINSIAAVRLLNGYEKNIPFTKNIYDDTALIDLTIGEELKQMECFALKIGISTYKTYEFQRFEYYGYVSEEGDEEINTFRLSNDFVEDEYIVRFSDYVRIYGEWHLSGETTDVNGSISIGSYGRNGEFSSHSAPIVNGIIQDTAIRLFPGGEVTFYLEISTIDGIVPDGAHSFIRIDNDMGHSDPEVNLKRTGGALSVYSNVLKVINETADISHIAYRCNEDSFGFPFSQINELIISQFIPIRLYSPQNVQEDKTYVKANGNVVTLFAKYYKEWEGETEYLSAEMHDKIVAALSCDEVYINDKRVTKSDKYQVDWENYDLDCDGVTKLARATFKVRENITQRNSNF